MESTIPTLKVSALQLHVRPEFLISDSIANLCVLKYVKTRCEGGGLHYLGFTFWNTDIYNTNAIHLRYTKAFCRCITRGKICCWVCNIFATILVTMRIEAVGGFDFCQFVTSATLMAMHALIQRVKTDFVYMLLHGFKHWYQKLLLSDFSCIPYALVLWALLTIKEHLPLLLCFSIYSTTVWRNRTINSFRLK